MDEALAKFKEKVSPLIGIDLAAYKDRQMERRIHALMSRANAPDPDTYLFLLQNDPARLQEFVDGLTINVSEWFRNPEKFGELEREILPRLPDQFGRPKIWSAGCSIGAEIYSVAILLDRLGKLGLCDLFGTDLDDRALERAAEASFAPHEQKGLTPDITDKYFAREAGGHLRLKKEISRQVRFEKHNLLSDPTYTDCHLILCRNVVIYFTEASKARLHRTFATALAPGGILFVGSSERIFGYRELGFSQARSFFYQKL